MKAQKDIAKKDDGFATQPAFLGQRELVKPETSLVPAAAKTREEREAAKLAEQELEQQRKQVAAGLRDWIEKNKKPSPRHE